jgi:hypothetical protein
MAQDTQPVCDAGDADDRFAVAIAELRDKLEAQLLVVCVAGSVANALVLGTTTGLVPATLTAMLPNVAGLTRLSQTAQECGDLGNGATALDKLVIRMTFTNGISAAFSRGTDPFPGCTIAAIAEAWRAVARDGYVVLLVFESLAEKILGSRMRPRHALVAPLLKAVRIGGWPCVEPDGRLSVPDMVERRSAPRRRVAIDVSYQSCGISASCRIIEVSRTGGRISGVGGLTPNSAILLKASAATIEGIVVWADRDQAGVLFVTPGAEELLTADAGPS